MTREQCKEDVKRWQKDSAIGGEFFSIDKLIDKLFSHFEVRDSLHEAQLKAKDDEIAELKWDFDTQKKSAIEAYSKNEDIDMLNESANNFFHALIDERKQRLYLFDCLKKERKKARSIVAMLFWEWRKDKRIYENTSKYKKEKETLKLYVNCSELSFIKAYAMIKTTL